MFSEQWANKPIPVLGTHYAGPTAVM